MGQGALGGEPDPLGSVADDPVCQIQDLVAADGNGSGHPPLFIQQVRDRRALAPESLPHQRADLRLRHDGARQPIFLGELAIRFGVLRTGEQQLHVASTQGGLQLHQLRGEELAEHALGTPVDQQHPIAAVVVQGNHPPIEVGQAGRGYRRPHLETVLPRGRHVLNPLVRSRQAAVQVIETQQQPALLLDRLVEEGPQAN